MLNKEIPSLNSLFLEMDVNGDGRLTKDEFLKGILGIEHLDITEIEVGRMFDSLDLEEKGYITQPEFHKAAHRWRWLRSVANVVNTCKENKFVVPQNYDYSKQTFENYRAPPGEYYGDFVKIREERDYSFHTNYTKERQLWQDMAIKSCLGRTEAQARPWVIYTCGPMGVGKGHVLSWLSQQGLFPLEYIVHVDPDFFKRIMPEWKGYLAANLGHDSDFESNLRETAAGTACHIESGYLQEIAMEAAMSERQNVWVDGSLSDGEWYSKVFDDHRKRFPHYRIAIFYITASEATVRVRIVKRSLETGRTIPESQIIRSLQNPEESLRILSPKTDLVVRIVNESSILLKCVEDHSGNWYRGLHKHFGVISHQRPNFPDWLGPLYFENTSLVGYPFVVFRSPREPCPTDHRISNHKIKVGFLEKKGLMHNWKTRWFVLRPGILLYYNHSKPEKTLKGECLITEHTTIEYSNGNHYGGVEEVEEPCSNSVPKLTKSPSSSFIFMRNLENTFTIHSIKPDGTQITLLLDAGNSETKNNWIDAIKTEIENAKKNVNATAGYYQNSHTVIRINSNATHNSPSLRVFLKKYPEFSLILSKMELVDMERVGRELMGMPHDAKHYCWIYPLQVLSQEDITQFDQSDPDVMLLRFGGFVCYDKDGRVIAVRAVTENKTQHVMMFGPHEFLRPEDVDRLHAGERWMPITSKFMSDLGVKYITFILPQEELPSRRFPPAFAFLFREPTEASDPRDRYFSPVSEY